MNCWNCNTQLVWGGDHDIEEDEDYVMETNLSCPNCGAFVLVYTPKPKNVERRTTYGEKNEQRIKT